MTGLSDLIALTLATGCLFTAEEEAPEHIRQLLRLNVMPQTGASAADVADALRQILVAGVDPDRWNLFGCAFSGAQWEAILGTVARDFGVHLE